jgi:hypothetical protein
MAEALPRDELNDFCTHEKISQSTMRVSPPRASVIRQAVAAIRSSFSRGGLLCENRGRAARFARAHFEREPVSLAGGREAAAGCVRAHRQTGSDNGNEKARSRCPGAGCTFRDDEPMPVICPTCQIIAGGASGRKGLQDNSRKIAGPNSWLSHATGLRMILSKPEPREVPP